MPIYVRGSDVPEGDAPMQVTGGKLSTKQIYGTESSMMVATRSAGYHSKPHVHDSEQLNYLLKGEVYVFVEDQVFHMRAGDFLRIPPNMVHWAWNRSNEDCELIECHAPPLKVLPEGQAASLLAENEQESRVRWVDNIFIAEEDMARYEAIEKKLLPDA